jgi:hypothetical protein
VEIAGVYMTRLAELELKANKNEFLLENKFSIS